MPLSTLHPCDWTAWVLCLLPAPHPCPTPDRLHPNCTGLNEVPAGGLGINAMIDAMKIQLSSSSLALAVSNASVSPVSVL